MSVQVWAVRIDRTLTETEYAALLALLPPQRRQRLLRLPAEKHAEVLCAYGLLLALLESRCGWTDLPEMETAGGGKPCFPAHPEVCFSISHTSGAAAAAVGNAPVGVDIQKIRPLSPRTVERETQQTPEAYFCAWSRREARAKRVGGGLLAMVRQEPLLSAGEFCSEPETFAGYAAGVAAGEPVPQSAVRCWTLDALLRRLDGFGACKTATAR